MRETRAERYIQRRPDARRRAPLTYAAEPARGKGLRKSLVLHACIHTYIQTFVHSVCVCMQQCIHVFMCIEYVPSPVMLADASIMLVPPQSLHLLLMWLCGQMFVSLQSLPADVVMLR